MPAILRDCLTLWRLRSLCGKLVVRDVQARYTGTVAGLVWVYLPPLLTMAAYYLVFDVVFAMRLGDGAPVRSTGVFLVAGMLPWMAFADAVSRGMNSLLDAGSVLQKNPLPPALFVTRSVVACLVVFGPLLGVLWLYYGSLHRFTVAAIAGFWFLLVLQALLSWLLAYVLAIFAAAVRDVVQVVGFLLGLGVFCSPILFPIGMFPERWQWLLWFNPMTGFVLGFQTVLLQGGWPAGPIWAAIGAWLLALVVVLEIAIRRSREELVDWL